MNPPLVRALAAHLRSGPLAAPPRRPHVGGSPRSVTPKLVELPAWAEPTGGAPVVPAMPVTPSPPATTPVPLGNSGMVLVVEPGVAGLSRELAPGVFLVAGIDAAAIGADGNVLSFIPGIVDAGLKGLSNLALTIASFWPKSGAREQLDARRQAELQARALEQAADPAYILANLLAQQQAQPAATPPLVPSQSTATKVANAAVGCAGCSCASCLVRR